MSNSLIGDESPRANISSPSTHLQQLVSAVLAKYKVSVETTLN